MNSFLNRLPRITDVSCTRVQPPESFALAAAPFSSEPGTVVLLSGTDLDCARYNILAARPWMTISAKSDNVSVCLGGESFSLTADPLDVVQSVIEHLSFTPSCVEKSATRENNTFLGKNTICNQGVIYGKNGILGQEIQIEEGDDLPVTAGLFGYLSYDLKDAIEQLPNTCMDQNLPDLYLSAPSLILIHDRHQEVYYQLQPRLEWPLDEKNAHQGLGRDSGTGPLPEQSTENWNLLSSGSLEGLWDNLSGEPFESNSFSIDPSGFQSNFSKSEYITAVERIIEYIKAGDIYQVNLSQRFSAGFQGNSYALFLKLFEKNPAPFFSFVNAGDHQVISTSPERFIRQKSREIETRPIKGTIQRGKSDAEDLQYGRTLMESFKDDAELSMIVDLMRNDFGKVAVGGSVRVKEHKRLEPYDNVFHLVSVVEGELSPDKSGVDLIRATFPGGSITGCPKIRSMEIIDELESVQRHVYTGSVGYISFHDTLDLSIAIRTAAVAQGQIGFSVGGGIVFDSDPEKEYEETLHKGRTLMETLLQSSANEKCGKKGLFEPQVCRRAWVNGKITPESKVVVSAGTLGFQYGAGLFETLKVENGSVLRLEQHVDRLYKSWFALFKEKLPCISWGDIIENLIAINGFGQGSAAAKIMVAQGERSSLGHGRASVKGEGDFFGVFIRPYTHRLKLLNRQDTGKEGLDLMTYPMERHTPLAAHKSLNYLYYHLAALHAKTRGYDEALILNADGTVSETNTCALIIVKAGQVFIPQSDFVLPSVTLAAALDLFSQAGYDIITRKIKPEELRDMGSVLLLNALMGAVPVLSIDGRKLPLTDPHLCHWLNKELCIKSTGDEKCTQRITS